MKHIASLLCLLVFVGCDFTAVSTSLCKGQRNDINGFRGNYNWDLGEGQLIPVSVKRLRRGEYMLSSRDGSEGMNYITCNINGVNIAESLMEGENGEPDLLSLFRVEVSSKNSVIKTLQFEEKTLQNNGINFELESTEIEGVPLSVINIDNSQTNARDLVNLSVPSNGKEPFYIELTR